MATIPVLAKTERAFGSHTNDLALSPEQLPPLEQRFDTEMWPGVFALGVAASVVGAWVYDQMQDEANEADEVYTTVTTTTVK